MSPWDAPTLQGATVRLDVRGGENRDTAGYALLEEDWPAVQTLLHRRLERSRLELDQVDL